MLKRFISALLICLFLLPTFAANADVIFSPEEPNSFYEEHISSILYLGRTFVASSESSAVEMKRVPDSEEIVATIQNGTTVYITGSCLYDGVFWGYLYFGFSSGWVRLDEMLVLYDYVSFTEEHMDEFYLYTGDYAEIKETKAANVWPYPGADGYSFILNNFDTEHFPVTYAYTDSGGNEWGFLTHLSDDSKWICLSDPMKSDFPVVNHEPHVWVSDTVHTDITNTPAEESISALVIMLVVALVAVTAVLIRIFWSPKKSRLEKNDES